MAGPTRGFWEERFQQGNTPWDRGAPSPQLHAWLAQRTLKPCRILVPGCGSGYEVAALAAAGFEVTALDYAALAVERTRQHLAAEGLLATVVEADALSWQAPKPFDAVYEQTCLCALYPDAWREYAHQLHQWLAPNGYLHALFVQIQRAGAPDGAILGPPYHCDINGMRALFSEPGWRWPKPPYPRVAHPAGFSELAVVLERR